MGRKHSRKGTPQVSKRQRHVITPRVDSDLMVRFNHERDRDREVWR